MKVETIGKAGQTFCYIVRDEGSPEATHFVTPDDAIPAGRLRRP